jgi:hypothetical protein
MNGLPDCPDGVTLATLLVVLGASFDPGNKTRIAAMLDLIAEVRRALDGERPERGPMQ